MRRPLQPRPPSCRRGEHGYNMVVLMVLVTVMNVLVAAALPAWSAVIQREKEQELIFRGLQYAEAIRVYQKRFGQFPTRLEDLVEVEPRSIRRLWEDPLTGEARWGLIFAGAGAPGAVPLPGGEGGQAGEDLGGGGGFPGGGGGDGDETRPTSGPDQRTIGPISGVYSLAEGEAMIEFLGKDRYDEWHFTVDVLQQAIAKAGRPPDLRHAPASQLPPGPTVPDLSSRWLGRPWPRQLQEAMQLQQGGVPGQPGQPGTAPAPVAGVPLEQAPPPADPP